MRQREDAPIRLDLFIRDCGHPLSAVVAFRTLEEFMTLVTTRVIVPMAAIAALLIACSDDDPTEPPTMAQVAGEYIAEGDVGMFTITSNGETVDVLAEGASVELTLTAEGVTSGRLFVPGGDEDGSNLEADLAGTWSLNGETVQFSHEADTFIRDTRFEFQDSRLSGDETFGDIRVQVVLQRR